VAKLFGGWRRGNEPHGRLARLRRLLVRGLSQESSDLAAFGRASLRFGSAGEVVGRADLLEERAGAVQMLAADRILGEVVPAHLVVQAALIVRHRQPLGRREPPLPRPHGASRPAALPRQQAFIKSRQRLADGEHP
jgi:hypothetical protein